MVLPAQTQALSNQGQHLGLVQGSVSQGGAHLPLGTPSLGTSPGSESHQSRRSSCPAAPGSDTEPGQAQRVCGDHPPLQDIIHYTSKLSEVGAMKGSGVCQGWCKQHCVKPRSWKDAQTHSPRLVKTQTATHSRPRHQPDTAMPPASVQ